jgi:hypothetical protein
MSLLRTKNGFTADTTARMRKRARQKASQAVPLAKSAGTAAMQGAGEAAALAKPHVHRARRWAAPRVERTGKAVQEKVAPQVSAVMTKAARRLDPDRKPRRRTRITRGIVLSTVAAGASAVVILLRKQAPLHGTGDNGSAAADTMHGTGDKSAPAADEATRVEVNGQVSAS